MDNDVWKRLAAPFAPNDIEWRIGQAGKGSNGIWAKVLAYITNRAIMHRLDDVLTPAGWRNEFHAGPQGGVVCGLSIRVDNEWITKWDGADNTDIESVKGGLSDAMKRAAVQWGIGRYLYDLEEGWAQIFDAKRDGSRYANCKIKASGKEEWVNFHWLPPQLPKWALPETAPAQPPKHQANGKATTTLNPAVGFKLFIDKTVETEGRVWGASAPVAREAIIDCAARSVGMTLDQLRECRDAPTFNRAMDAVNAQTKALAEAAQVFG